MHPDELSIDIDLVGRLVAAWFPQGSDLPLSPVPSAGTDNAMFRLGHELAVRLPRIHWAAQDPDKERRWLPLLAPRLSLAIPVPVGGGPPDFGYPYDWSVVPWLPGEPATEATVTDLSDAAVQLGRFVAELRRLPAPTGSTTNLEGGRGVPLSARDADTRRAIADLGSRIDPAAVTAAWETALAAPPWTGPPAWFHGDLMSGNLLARDGRLSAVIDWGTLGFGDPACDGIVAWNLFSGQSRAVYRRVLGVDDAAWARGRGWALSIALVALPYYLETNPTLVKMSWRVLREVLADHEAA